MLEVAGIRKKYAGSPLLEGVSFGVPDGETVCLLGPSGSGKSTLLRIIAGLEPPDAGQVIWNGADLAAVPPHRRDFGLVFQDYALFPHLDVFSNAAFGLKMRARPVDEIKARVAEVLDLVNMSGFDSRKVTDLSGGEQQRVALARALAPHPRLLMFDEPLGALDRTLKDELLTELRGILRAARVPAIYVTHDQEEAYTIGDRILILHAGAIVCEGTPGQVTAEPGSAWVAGFLGLGDIVTGKITAQDGRRWRVKTPLGTFQAVCGAGARVGKSVSVLIRPGSVKPGSGRDSLKTRVSDVVFQKDGYRVALENGLTITLEQPPRLRQEIRVRIGKVECLD
jgi:ABC-type Fe3+/spermidine/putrescine transport system ATPase subunit